MDYVVGGVAALISGNVTPNRPKLLKRAFTPTKHQPSPNVTPKSEFVDDRSIFLSPTMQKKKAIVKKSPKRIFQGTDLDVTMDDDDSNCVPSPKADKVKKHLKDDLDSSTKQDTSVAGQKEGKIKRNKSASHTESESNEGKDDSVVAESEPKPKKNKKKRNSVSESKAAASEGSEKENEVKSPEPAESSKSDKKKNRKRNNSESKEEDKNSTDTIEKPIKASKAKMRRERMKRMKLKYLKKVEKEEKLKLEADTKKIQEFIQDDEVSTPPKAKKSKKSTLETPEEPTQQEDQITEEPQSDQDDDDADDASDDDSDDEIPETVNPNAITNKDTDSEHESDDDIQSEDDEENKKVLAADAEEQNSSDDDEEEETTVKHKVKESKKKNSKDTDKPKGEKPEYTGPTSEELKRTIFVGNVPFSSKCKKEIKKIFTKYGEIETVRIRSVPVADSRMTPKLAIIKNELHPERTTVNVYVKFADEAAVETALNENNTKLNHHHLRVSRSDSTGAEHDPRRAVYVGNIPFALQDTGLRDRFEKCGEIESVRIVRDKKTGVGKGFGYVNFTSKDGVELALALSDEDLTIKNRILRVSRCQQNPNKKRPTQAGPNGPPGQNRGLSGQNRGPSGQNRGPTDQRGSFGQNRGPPGQNRGPGQDRGSFGQNRGPSGQRGSFGQNRGPPGQDRGSFGHNRGPPGQRGSFGQNRGPPNRGPPAQNRFGQNRGQDRPFGQNRGPPGQNRGPPGQNRGGPVNWQNRGPPGNDDQAQGALRRMNNKRKSEEGGDDGPASKKANVPNPPGIREKKPKKEFVGMTAEKKKKSKFNKGDKKKKALSEILTKK